MSIFTDRLIEFRNENENESESDTKKWALIVKGSFMQNIKERFIKRRKHH